MFDLSPAPDHPHPNVNCIHGATHVIAIIVNRIMRTRIGKLQLKQFQTGYLYSNRNSTWDTYYYKLLYATSLSPAAHPPRLIYHSIRTIIRFGPDNNNNNINPSPYDFAWAESIATVNWNEYNSALTANNNECCAMILQRGWQQQPNHLLGICSFNRDVHRHPMASSWLPHLNANPTAHYAAPGPPPTKVSN